ncbi:MAG TPA: hypothetical protein VK589_21215 [Chryseolinea sp.]|nr:hypothetical protein [Chryseolinea sp.]
MYKIVTLALIVSCYYGKAQSWERSELESLRTSPDVFYLPAHTFFSEVAWRDSIYLFPSFQYGRITFATGYSPEDKVLMNYDLYSAEMALITKDGDTTHLKRTKELKLLNIGDHLFLQDYKVGYIEIIQQLPVSLGVLNVMSTEHMEYVSGNREGGTYGMDTRGTPSVYDRYYRKGKLYYFIDRDNKVYKATRASILKLFRKNKDEIDVYRRENKIDFENRSDLVKLLRFCNEMTN